MSKDPEMYVLPTSTTHFYTHSYSCSKPLHLVASKDVTNIYSSISGRMTGALTLYSGTFMRYALAVTPANYLLFGCHAINFSSQLVQGYRYLNYWNFGGRDAALAQKAKEGVSEAKDKAGEVAEKVKEAVGK